MDGVRTEHSERTDSPPLDATFSALADGARRRLVGFLHRAGSEPVPPAELAAVLAAHERGKPPGEVTPEERREAGLALRHRHLPKLSAAGLLDREAADEAVALADHPALRDAAVLEAVGGDAPADPASLDALFDALANGRRRTVLDVLSHQFGPIHVETLARELEARQAGTRESEVAPEDVERTSVRLRHADLPRLAEAGLIECGEEQVAYSGHPALRVPWMHSVFEPDFRASVTGESEPEGIGEIEGRERVVSYGQSMLETADEELFCMFTDTQLLKTGCLSRVRNAARDRDVDVYLGTRDPAVREYVAEHAPEVVLWEPDTDWTTLPAAGDRVGRLVMADREAVLLGTLAEERSDGLREEEAIIGEGEDDTLVTMIRQLVAPHLERIDSETDDVAGRIPL